jgi:transposase
MNQRESFIARGELNGNSKLTAAKVIELRERYARRTQIGQRTTIRQLAQRFGLSMTHVWRILHREVWKDVA